MNLRMDAQRREEITDWDRREFSGGFEGLRRFADRGLSGAATDGTGWLFMFDGHVVGTVGAELDAFADASGTVYEAPHRVLPVLFAMQERGGEPRTQYYTNDTPLSEADRTLSQGGFTGYIELSENVLSGDYYVAYTAGESMTAAYVGNSRRLETGDDAFELADDEVGIYTVYEVDLDVRELPTPDRTAEDDGAADGIGASGRGSDGDESKGDGSAANGPGAGDDAVVGGGEVDETEAVRAGSDAAEAGSDTAVEAPGGIVTDPRDVSRESDGDSSEGNPAGSDGSDHATDEPDPATTADTDGAGGTAAADETEDGDAPSTGTDPGEDQTNGPGEDQTNGPGDRTVTIDEGTAADEGTGTGRETDPDGHTGVDGAKRTSTDPAAGPAERDRGGRETGADEGSVTPDRARPEDDRDDDVFSDEAEWREAKSIPPLDPSETGDRDERGVNDGRASRSAAADAEGNAADRAGEASTDRSSSPRSTDGVGTNRTAVSRSAGATSEELRERIEQLEAALEEVEAKREALATERDELTAERDELKAERDALEAERDELRDALDELEAEHETVEAERDRLDGRVEELRSEVDRLREKLSAAEEKLPSGDRTISAAEARDGTNLFVRYESKGGATLEDAHGGAVDREELRSNIRIERHTTFETDGLLVDGEPFEEFLTGTMEHRFTRWVVEELPFEVSETGNRSALRDLYDALPEIDRAEIGGSVSIATREASEETTEDRSFDLVLRDRMGHPLFVAELNDTRTPTAGGTLESLVANGGAIAEANDTFAGAFAVTASFFEPDALEAASDAVGGGLFNRSKRDSFVKLSRKRGYHLCLVESRDGGFHMTVPDL